MNSKKFISGVSAFAIAASAFAGMAVTASATAVEPLNWKVVANETDPDTGDVITATPWSGNATLGTDGDLVTFTAGTNSGNRADTYAFDNTQTYTAGIVNVSYTINLSSNNGVSQRSVATFDLKGNGRSIVKVESTNWAPEGTAGKAAYWSEYNVIAGAQTDPITINSGNTYTVNISVNLDEHKVSYTVSGNGQNVEQTDIAIDESITNVNQLYIQAPRGGAVVKLGAFTVENILSPAGAINAINYTDGTNVLGTSTSANDLPSVAGKSVGETVKVSYPRYVLSGTTLYEKSATNKEYRMDYTLSSSSASSADISGYAASNITNVVYHSEGENIAGFTATDGGTNIPSRCSNAKIGYVAANTTATITTLPAGKYKVYTQVYKNNSGDMTIPLMLGSNDISFIQSGSTNGNLHTSAEITLSETTALTLGTCGSSKDGVDYIYVVKTGDYVAPAADFNVTMGNGTLANGNDGVATWYIATVTNDGNAEGSFDTMTLYKGETASTPQRFSTAITIEANAYAYIGVIVNGLDTTADEIAATVE